MLNLDTHILIFALLGDLQPDEENLLARNGWSISAIALWELAKLIQLGRVSIDVEDRDPARILDQIHVWPINLEIALASTRLDFQGDPADELIAATSVVHNVPLPHTRPNHPQLQHRPPRQLDPASLATQPAIPANTQSPTPQSLDPPHPLPYTIHTRT